MRSIITIFSLAIAVMFTACEGPEGPPGLDGVDGEDGLVAQVFEVEDVNFEFNADNGLQEANFTFIDFTSFDVQANDALLIYRFDGTVEFDDNTSEDAWSALPQNFFFDDGTIQYVFNHTTRDAQIQIDGNVDLENLDTAFTLDQIFRFVIIPGAAAQSIDPNSEDLINAVANLRLDVSTTMEIPTLE